jgi:4-hydroxy-tetrahydrodipicolinate synthase
LDRLLEKPVREGTDFLVVLGTTGEASMLSDSEKKEVTEYVIRRNAGRLPVVLGLGGNNTAAVVQALSELKAEGIDAVLSVCPYYVRPTQEGLYRHFEAVAQASPRPVVLYNVPARTGVNMTAETTLKIAHEVSNVAGIKDATLDMQQLHKLISGKPAQFKVLSGDDAMALPAVLSGADGVISVIGQALPGAYGAMIHTGLAGDAHKAYQIFNALSPLLRSIYLEGNPAGVKALLSHMDVSEPGVRLPLVPATQKLFERIGMDLDRLRTDALSSEFPV